MVDAILFVVRRRLLVSAVGLVVLLLVTFSYIAVGALGINPIASTMSVRIQLAESGGLLANQDVTVRGIPVGRVTAINLTDDGVEAVAAIDAATRIPRSSPVRVSGLSAAGEQYVDFRPTDGEGPFLTDGSVIDKAQTSVTVSLPQIIDDSRGALAQLDTDQLNTLFAELRVSRDGADKLAAIFDGASFLASTLDGVLPQTVSMLRTTRTVLNTAADLNDGLLRTSLNLQGILHGVEAMDGGFRQLVDRGSGQLQLIDAFIADNRENVVQLLGNLTSVSQLLYLRTPALADLWRPDRDSMVDRVSSVIHDNGIWAVADIYPRYSCDYGLPRRPPSQADFPEPYLYTYCDDPDPSVLIRGARNAPRPAGDDTAGPPPDYDPHATTDPTPNYPPYTIPTPYAGPEMPVWVPN
ncbi:mammalian cell entry protein [Mycolicibacillus trivialis]|uniref:Mammalian cell entry protein n=1 Tax=Mycolicibacillus trivialis TaxID=1798 RepID=A0A1X2EPE0_9MYCO|nr:mammalian cell entry protein [Mycolicibacillus trivialis]